MVSLKKLLFDDEQNHKLLDLHLFDGDVVDVDMIWIILLSSSIWYLL